MTLDFFKEKHGYEIEGVWFPRVTTIIALTNTAYFLNGSDPSKSRFGIEQAAEWGTITHETVEKILKKETVQVEARMAITIEAFQDWHDQNQMKIADPENDLEKRVLDMDHGYAGTVDIVAEINGVTGIMDLKTSTSILREHSLQTAAYMNAYNKMEEGDRVCTTRWILRIDQYQECLGCLAKRREKYGRARVAGGKSVNWRVCNHQWSATRGEVEFRELKNHEKDFEAFLDLKERWGWNNKEWLDKIPNYEGNLKQHTLL
jgi:hypothetical protein